MGMKGVRKLSRRMFKNFCKRDRDLWRSYENACKNDEDFLTELCKFLESIEKCLIQVKDMEKNGGGSDGYMTILEKLKNVHDQNSADMLKKVECLITQRKDLQGELTSELNQLIGENEKPRKKTACVGAWRRCLRMATYMLFIGAVAAFGLHSYGGSYGCSTCGPGRCCCYYPNTSRTVLDSVLH
ncbi:hypothetical protein M0R45_008030 [Rubus argutus]|uniref:Uncharacterized protein n=1 Tax=Rubus argutus TaxID=59490 RepID=A0AAW1XZI7_RUBAR